MWYTKRRITPYEFTPREIGGCLNLSYSEFYQPSNIDTFYFERGKIPGTDLESVSLTTDIVMLFNQKRLDRMSQSALIDHFNSMSLKSSSFASLRKKLTDDQLCSIVKSRYIQSPSELLNYSNYLVKSLGAELAAAAQGVEQDKGSQNGTSSAGNEESSNE